MNKRSGQITRLILLGMGCTTVVAVAQAPTSAREIAVTVVNANPQPAQPVKSAKVKLTHTFNAQLAVDAEDSTDSRGEAHLVISPGAADRIDLRLIISDAGELVIYQPAEGQLATGLGPAVNAITIQLLPKGSPLLGGQAQINALLARVSQMSQQVKSLERQNAALKQQNASPQPQLTAAQLSAQAQQQEVANQIAAWAESNGFAPDQANAMVKQWGLENKDKESALSAFALNNYTQAARVFTSEADTAREARATVPQTDPEQNRELLRRELKSSRGSANSFQMSGQYRQATQALEKVRDDAAQAHQKAPADAVVLEIWLDAVWEAAEARCRESDVVPADQGIGLLALSADDFRALLREYAAVGERKNSAMAENNLAVTLTAEGERASGDKATALFDQAVKALQDALDSSMTTGDVDIRIRAPLNIAVVDFVASRFSACLQQTAAIDDPRLPPDVTVLRDALKFACEWGAGDKKSALLMDQSLQARLQVADLMRDQSLAWDFDPITFFAENSPTFAPGRASWMALLTAARDHDSAGMIAALRQLEPILKK